MKKSLIIFVIGVVLTSTLAGADNITGSIETEREHLNSTNANTNFTHTVFAEYGATTTCPYCPSPSEALYNIYNNSDGDFYYVSFVVDGNQLAAKRMQRYNLYYIPTVYFEGGYKTDSGTLGPPEDNESRYMSLINESGNRTQVHPININMSVTWEGNATVTVEINVRNDGDRIYFGRLRSHVTEIISRWNNYDGDPYYFGFLDYAFDRFILIFPGRTFTASAIWDGREQHGNQTFEDITEDNVMVISTVSHWQPHLKKNDWNEPLRSILYLAFYVDQTCAAVPE